VCVDQSGNGNSWQAIGHLLWGPKSWSVRFEGQGFRLSPLGHRDTFRMIFSPKIGKLMATKSGTCLRLECDATANQRLATKMILGIGTTVFALVIASFMTASLPSSLTRVKMRPSAVTFSARFINSLPESCFSHSMALLYCPDCTESIPIL
jgi:hypothetical protein